MRNGSRFALKRNFFLAKQAHPSTDAETGVGLKTITYEGYTNASVAVVAVIHPTGLQTLHLSYDCK